jgi:hypothetical protein
MKVETNEKKTLREVQEELERYQSRSRENDKVIPDYVVSTDLLSHFHNQEKSDLKCYLYNIQTIQYKRTFNNFEEADSMNGSFLNVQHLLLNHPEFPFGYAQKEYEQFKRILNKRYEDIISRRLTPPNFKDENSYGLNEMRAYLNDASLVGTPKPKVKGKTILITMADYSANCEHQTKRNIINNAFLHNFENVEHPMSYLLKWDYTTHVDHRKSGMNVVYGALNLAYRLMYVRSSYEIIDNHLSEYEIILFNFFAYPLRDRYIDVMMNFLLVFHKQHPQIYLKDVSGVGYNGYRKYSFYEELVGSKIDISARRATCQ